MVCLNYSIQDKCTSLCRQRQCRMINRLYFNGKNVFVCGENSSIYIYYSAMVRPGRNEMMLASYYACMLIALYFILLGVAVEMRSSAGVTFIDANLPKAEAATVQKIQPTTSKAIVTFGGDGGGSEKRRVRFEEDDTI